MLSKECIEEIICIKKMSSEIVAGDKFENINKVYSIISKKHESKAEILQFVKEDLLALFVIIIRKKQTYKINENTKILLMKIVSLTSTHNKIDHNELMLFFNLLGSLLQEIYLPEQNKLRDTSEEIMWQALNCVRILFDAATEGLCFFLYTKENAVKICKIIFVVGEIIKTRCRKLKVEAIKCLMAVFRVNDEVEIEDYFTNIRVAQTIADCFAYFLPGISFSLGSVILEGYRAGQIILELTIIAMGHILTILLKNYRKNENTLEDAKSMVLSRLNSSKKLESHSSKDKMEDYMKMERSREWFETADKHLAPIFSNFKYLAQHESHRVRLKLAEMCYCIIKHSFMNIRESSYPLLEILIIMTSDENKEVSKMSKHIFDLPILDNQVNSMLSHRFSQTFSKIPNIFNGIDTREQINILKLTAASIKIVGKKIICNDSFKEFQRVLLYLCELKIDTSSSNEMSYHKSINTDEPVVVNLWKDFKFMHEESVRNQFAELCQVLFEADLFPVLSDYLINIITFEEEKVEAFYLMNQLLYGINKAKPDSEEGLLNLIMPIFQMYVDHWDIALQLDQYDGLSAKELGTNILLASLLCEGVGLMSIHARGEKFRPFLFNCLYKLFVSAASGFQKLMDAAKKSLTDMARALGYPKVSNMLHKNMDFFLFHFQRDLKKGDDNVLKVMEILFAQMDTDIIHHYGKDIHEVLTQSLDVFKQKNRLNAVLRAFWKFLEGVKRCFSAPVPERVPKTKAQIEKEKLDSFRVEGLDNDVEVNNFSDDIMGKSAEELYKEDMERKKTELEKEYIEPEVEGYKKPESPAHINMTVDILKRSLNYLPSKSSTTKIAVMLTLSSGVEIIRDYEDELLPIVHLIWSPLVGRFKEEDPNVLEHAFKLLVKMARFSKDFIRNRMAKDVLPSLISFLTTSSRKSYMQDKGSAYRYTKEYRLQQIMLQDMYYLVTDTELLESDVGTILNTVAAYLSNKQPKPLQEQVVKLFELLHQYEPTVSYDIVFSPKEECEKNLEKLERRGKLWK